jgi:hypothetical protein
MRQLLVLGSMLIVATSLGGHATGATAVDLPKSATKILDLKPGVTYQASLFVPHVRITIPVAGWKGSQHVSHGYNWFFLGWRDRGGMAVISAPGSRQSAATTLHRLQTERANTPAVGITTQPAVAVTVAGFQGQQFEEVGCHRPVRAHLRSLLHEQGWFERLCWRPPAVRQERRVPYCRAECARHAECVLDGCEQTDPRPDVPRCGCEATEAAEVRQRVAETALRSLSAPAAEPLAIGST